MGTTSRRCFTSDPELRRSTRLLLQLGLLVFEALFLGGIFAALLGWRPGAFLAVAGMTLMFASIAIGAVIGYRRTMNRPWPKVPPIDDWDDDW